MTAPFLSEIKIMSFDFAPKGWAQCNGQLLPINQNQALFSLLGTTYGGDGRVNFALPNLQGLVPVHVGNGHTLGERAGEQAHTLIQPEMPTHTHSLLALAGVATTATPATNTLTAAVPPDFGNAYAAAANLAPMAVPDATPGPSGGSQAHTNLQPFLTLNFCIALQGIFPSPN